MVRGGPEVRFHELFFFFFGGGRGILHLTDPFGLLVPFFLRANPGRRLSLLEKPPKSPKPSPLTFMNQPLPLCRGNSKQDSKPTIAGTWPNSLPKSWTDAPARWAPARPWRAHGTNCTGRKCELIFEMHVYNVNIYMKCVACICTYIHIYLCMNMYLGTLEY